MTTRFEDYLGEAEDAYAARPRSALEDVASTHPPSVGLRLEDGGLIGVVLVRANLSDQRFAERIQAALSQTFGAAHEDSPTGVDAAEAAEAALPAPGRAQSRGDELILRLGADELLALTAYDAASALAQRLREACAAAPEHAALCENFSDGFALIKLSGPSAREALAHEAPIDLHPRAFAPGDVRRALVAGVEATLLLRSEEAEAAEGAKEPCFEILAPRSQAAALYRRLSRIEVSGDVF